jgi:hypothetical protein
MATNHNVFLKTYYATKSAKAKAQLLKNYMLSLDSEALDIFILGNMDELANNIAAQKGKITENEKQKALEILETSEELLLPKVKRKKAV